MVRIDGGKWAVGEGNEGQGEGRQWRLSPEAETPRLHPCWRASMPCTCARTHAGPGNVDATVSLGIACVCVLARVVVRPESRRRAGRSKERQPASAVDRQLYS